jgi:hypothetical protein
VVSELRDVVTGLRQFYGSPLVRSTGTHSRDDEAKLGENRQLPANFTYVAPHVEVTDYPTYPLSERQLNRVEQHKYYSAIKEGIQTRWGNDRYAVQKSRHRMFIIDGQQRVFSCNIRSHTMRCAYLELLSLNFDVVSFLAQAGGKTVQQYQAMISPDHL